MLKNEAHWVRQALADLSRDELNPLLDIGGGANTFRSTKQPWIAAAFEPVKDRDVRIIRHEFTDGPGVDVAGDLDDPLFLDVLARAGASSVICCNVLEHLRDRTGLLNAFPRMVPVGGHLILTVPKRFPYHPDPIDTRYRPSLGELEAELPEFRLVTGEEVACGTLLRYLSQVGSPAASLARGVSTALSGLRRGRSVPPTTATAGTSVLEVVFRPTTVTCGVFQRTTATRPV